MRLMEQQRGQGVRVSDIAQAAGVSRQAVYLHFSNRTDLLVATVRFADELYGVNQRLAPILAATSGVDALRGLIDFWGNYIPMIYGLARALLDTRATDTAAASAWEDRMQALRSGCQATIDCLRKCGELRSDLDPGEAVDLLWSLLGIGIWENLTVDCGWSNEHYIRALQDLVLQTFVRR